MKKLFEFSPEDVYLKIESPNEIEHMLRNGDKNTSSRLIKLLLDKFERELFLGGSVLKNQIYNRPKNYNDIDFLIVSESEAHYNTLLKNNFHKIEELKNINKEISELKPKKENILTDFPHICLTNSKGSDFHLHFDYYHKDKSTCFHIPDYR